MSIGYIKSSYDDRYFIVSINLDKDHAFYTKPRLSKSNYGIRIVR